MAVERATTHTRLPSLVFGLGMVLVFVGERVLSAGAWASSFVGLGFASLGLAIFIQSLSAKRAPAGRVSAEKILKGFMILGLGALVVYLVNSDFLVMLTGRALDQLFPATAAFSSTLWPAIWVASVLPILFVELSLATMAKAPVLDRPRVIAAARAGLGIALALVFSCALVSAAGKQDVQSDFSHFRTALPGEATRRVVEALDKPVDVALFFPPANDVREQVERYFGSLGPPANAYGSKTTISRFTPKRPKRLTSTTTVLWLFAATRFRKK